MNFIAFHSPARTHIHFTQQSVAQIDLCVCAYVRALSADGRRASISCTRLAHAITFPFGMAATSVCVHVFVSTTDDLARVCERRTLLTNGRAERIGVNFLWHSSINLIIHISLAFDTNKHSVAQRRCKHLRSAGGDRVCRYAPGCSQFHEPSYCERVGCFGWLEMCPYGIRPSRKQNN